MKKVLRVIGLCTAILLLCCAGCSILGGKVQVKQYYVLNYVSSPQTGGLYYKTPYPFILRLQELGIEEAYARPQIVYRQNPFELRYYNNKLWAVKPNRMISDLIFKQIVTANLVSQVVRRYDEGLNPDFELTGLIEALEEYDSDQLWFAHLAIRLTLTRLSDGRVMYFRRFDNRKRVFKYSPEMVVQELSAILEFIMNQALRDVDGIFKKEAGIPSNPIFSPDSARLKEIEKFRSNGGE